MFEVVVWDYDAAPDAAEYFSQNYTEEQEKESILPYYCARRLKCSDLGEAKEYAVYQCKEKHCVGAAVFKEGEKVFGFGLTFPYKKNYF